MPQDLHKSRIESVNRSADIPLLICSIILLLLAYSFSASSNPLLEDDSLFILASYFAGIAHSPGYPVYVLMSQLSHLLPIESVALRVHLFSSLAGALTCGCIYWLLVTEFGVKRWIALAAALSLGFSSRFWSLAIVAEVYALNGLFFTLLLWSALFITKVSNLSSLQLFAIGGLYGLSLSNHWPLTILMSPVFVIIAHTKIKQLTMGLHYVSAGLLAGLLPYLWMTVRSWDESVFSHMGSLNTVEQVVYFVSRAVYAATDDKAIAGFPEKLLYLQLYIQEFSQQFGPIGRLFIIIGFIRQWYVLPPRMAWGLSAALALPPVLIFLVNFTYTPLEIASMRAYPLPLYIVAGIWLALGLETLLRIQVKNLTLDARTRLRHGLVYLLALTTVLGVIWTNRNTVNTNAWAVSHGKMTLHSLPEDSTLFVMDDWSMAVISYLQLVENYRPDVSLYSEYGTFLPGRLFSYFGTSYQSKSKQLAEFTANSPSPIFMLQNPARYDLSAHNYGLFYGIGSTESMPNIDNKAIQDYFESILTREPEGQWNQLHWRQQIKNFIRTRESEKEIAVLMSLERDSFTVPLEIADHLMSVQKAVDSTTIASLLEEAAEHSEGKDDLQIARLRLLQGTFLAGTGAADAAAEMFEDSLRMYPVAYNPALSELAGNYLQRCELEKLQALANKFSVLEAIKPDECTTH